MPVILAISILFILGSILVFTNVIRSYKKESTEEAKLVVEKEVLKGTEEEEAVEEQNEQEIHLSDSTKEEEKGEQQKQESIENIENTKTKQEESTQNLSEKTNYALEIVVKALGEVKVSYQEDKGEKRAISLKEDQFKVLKGRENIFIETDQSDLIYIFHNGKNLGMFGSGGKKEQIFSSEDL